MPRGRGWDTHFPDRATMLAEAGLREEELVDLLGLPPEEGRRWAERRGLSLRVVEVDGRGLNLRSDLRTHPLNAAVADGVIQAIVGIG